MGRSKPRKIKNQKHLKFRSVSVSGYATKGGKKVGPYSSHRWKRKHRVRKVILPRHGDQDRAVRALPDVLREAGYPEIAASEERRQAQIREANTDTITQEIRAEDRQEELNRLTEQIRVTEAQERRLAVMRGDQRKKLAALMLTLKKLDKQDISKARYKDLKDELDNLDRVNNEQYRLETDRIENSGEENISVSMAQMQATHNEHQKRWEEINNARVLLDSTTRKPKQYAAILGDMRAGRDANLINRNIYSQMPSIRSSRQIRRLSAEDRNRAKELSELDRFTTQLQYLDNLTKVAADAGRSGKWKKTEAENLEKDITATRQVLFTKASESKAFTFIDPQKQSDLTIGKAIKDTTEMETQARKYKGTIKGLSTMEEMLKERRTFMSAYLENRKSDEQLNRPKTINELTKFFNENNVLRDRKEALTNSRIQTKWAEGVGMERPFISDKSMKNERARFHADVNAAITRSQYMTGYEDQDGKPIKGILELQKEIKKKEEPVLTGKQMQEWMQLHPEVRWQDAIAYDKPQVSPSLASLGATIDLKDLPQDAIIKAQRENLDDEPTDFTLGLFKHSKKGQKKRRTKK